MKTTCPLTYRTGLAAQAAGLVHVTIKAVGAPRAARRTLCGADLAGLTTLATFGSRDRDPFLSARGCDSCRTCLGEWLQDERR